MQELNVRLSKLSPAAAAAIAQAVCAAPHGARVAVVDSAARHLGCSRTAVYRAIAAVPDDTRLRAAIEAAELKAVRLRLAADKAARLALDAEREAAELRELAREHEALDTQKEVA